MTFNQKRSMSAVQPNNVARLKMTIQATATALRLLSTNSVAPLIMIPIPMVIVNPRTIAGSANLTGLMIGAGE